MENEKTIAVLNTLITINNDRIEGYETASKEIKNYYKNTPSKRWKKIGANKKIRQTTIKIYRH